jgi:hypothetical protein
MYFSTCFVPPVVKYACVENSEPRCMCVSMCKCVCLCTGTCMQRMGTPWESWCLTSRQTLEVKNHSINSPILPIHFKWIEKSTCLSLEIHSCKLLILNISFVYLLIQHTVTFVNFRLRNSWEKKIYVLRMHGISITASHRRVTDFSFPPKSNVNNVKWI